jgi:two-component system nitrogen regulation sensor histidine kinase NtrY
MKGVATTYRPSSRLACCHRRSRRQRPLGHAPQPVSRGRPPHQLVVIGDLSRTLREEELRAWQRLVRVLGHELNNSLAPIKSITGSRGTLLRRTPRVPDWEDDMCSGLEIIETRADGLGRFMQAYASLARLPALVLARCDVPALIHRVVALETRLAVMILEGPALAVPCDAAQIEQVLINLVKKAVEAASAGAR